MIRFMPWMALSFLLLISFANAETSQFDSPTPSTSDRLRSLYLGAELSGGTTALNASTTSIGSGTGSTFSGALIGTWNIGQWTIDGGAGFFESSVTGKSNSISQFQLSTNSLLAHVSPQYRVFDNLQIGPIAELLFGADVGFETGLSDSAQEYSWLVGAQALYAFHLGANPLKVGVRYLTSLNLPENSLNAFEATVQFGLPIY